MQRLIHAAALHLGRRRLDGVLPDTDFRDVFEHIAQVAIREHADALLLAGDLFDHPQVQPQHLRQAQDVLRPLRQAGVPVIATEGNHDQGFLHSTAPTWLHYLAEEDLLYLLTTRFDAQGPRLEPWDPSSHQGSFLDLGGVRFVGAGYLGAATPHKVRQIAARLDPDRCHVMLLHAGPDYFVGEGGGFSKEDLEALRSRVTYLALGHIHKPMVHGGWACNPGSPENTDLSEARYEVTSDGRPRPRGFARVHINPLQRAAPAFLEVGNTPRRPVLPVTLDCTDFGNKLKGGENALIQAAAERVRSLGPTPAAVAVVRLLGTLNLKRIPIDRDRVARAIAEAAGIAATALELTGLNLDAATLTVSGEAAVPSREQLERLAVRGLVEADPFWAEDPAQDAVADLFLALKDAVGRGRTPAEIAESLAAHALVDRVQARRSRESGVTEPTGNAEASAPDTAPASASFPTAPEAPPPA
ncbi:MAG: DNA repair exonuclease [Verrucomicrobiales bacterium]|nr:DNA repair exonuclease [Verrucomicrobiales bacterium]